MEECVKSCPEGALKITGEYMKVEEVMEEIEKDELFYRNSGGGVTLSGGDPLYQSDFACKLLEECKNAHIHTAVDTSGYAKWETWEKILKYTDLVLFDIKHMDSEKHKEGTDVGNEIILENVARVAEKVRTWIRVPIIPRYNDGEENIKSVAEFASEINVEKVSLLGYHELGWLKYEGLDKDREMEMPYFLKHVHGVEQRELDRLKRLIEAYGKGLKVTLGY
jgi:pyruvate formate lyase activating enzyme